MVAVYAGGVGVDQAFAKGVHVYPVAIIAEVRQVLLVASEGADADRPGEGRRPEPPAGAVVARRGDQGDVVVPPTEVTEGEQRQILAGVTTCGNVDHVR